MTGRTPGNFLWGELLKYHSRDGELALWLSMGNGVWVITPT